MKTKIAFLLTLSLISFARVDADAETLKYELYARGGHDLSIYEYIFPLDFIQILFDNEIQLTDQCNASVYCDGEIIASAASYTIQNWHSNYNEAEQGELVVWFESGDLPKGHTYTLRLTAGSVADLDDPTRVNEELNLPLTVPANLNHYFLLDGSKLKISEDSPKKFSGCSLHISTEVDPIGSPVIYLKRNGETIGEYPAVIRMHDWDLSSCQANFPAVTLDEGAEYTLVLPANSCCSQYRSDLTNDELTIVIQEGSSAITEVELTDSDRNQPIYDLTGRRVLNPGKGLYIINGRKTLLR